mgnify:CR=1 FL=1
MNKISFIGLGNMGTPMVSNLLKHKYDVKVFDINKNNYKPFKKTNAIIVEKKQELSEDKRIFISMLPDGDSLKKLVLGKNGLLNNLKKNSIFIDCSSVDYNTTVIISEKMKKKGVYFLDSPVSGGISGAKNATLTIMVGGNKKAFDKSKTILNTLGKNIIYVGKSGTGQIVKACNNMMLGINMVGVCEAFLLAKKYKIDLKKFYDITSKSSGSSWAMNTHLPIEGIVKSSAANNNFKPGYAAKLILKDLQIAQDMAKHANIKTSLGLKALKLYKKFCNLDKNNLDYSAIIKILSKI